ncbi:5'-methylthioadenosine phosphorylase [hydrothermal vent metagenome]|uniref:5'-methylthioadenosine phosphorylase n=1 Tax=hydrothermal vent metagenome TaxID=652676 RepID=A0A3B1CJS9_9ZZZZ
MSRLAIIGGSQAHELLKKEAFDSIKPQKSIKTPFGKSPKMYLCEKSGVEFYFISRHGDDGYKIAAPFVNYRANIWALKEKGVEKIISWSGPGIINPGFEVGAFAVPHDLIDMTRSRPGTFFEKGGLGFIRMRHPFCPDLRHAIIYSLQSKNCKHYDHSVYCATQGPRLETPAEIKLYHSYGADLVGMTLCPEAFLARELEMCYASICYLTNFAEGIAQRDYRGGELFEGMTTPEEKRIVEDAMGHLPSVVIHALKTAATIARECECKDAMLRYKKRGDIGKDFRQWINPK